MESIGPDPTDERMTTVLGAKLFIFSVQLIPLTLLLMSLFSHSDKNTESMAELKQPNEKEELVISAVSLPIHLERIR